MKKTLTLLAITAVIVSPVMAQEVDASKHDMMHSYMHQTNATNDHRISLGLSPQMKEHQLANMRSHVEAVHDIVGLLAEDQFDEAAVIAHQKLGLTPEMKKMCNMFNNADFTKLGLAFHQQADKLAEVLKTHDMKRSLSALHLTMNSCVQCHATFRQ